ncbi:MAG: hypothetical protein ACE15C_11465 [Phycisphaerae bacterium]
MNIEGTPVLPHGGYRKLRSFKFMWEGGFTKNLYRKRVEARAGRYGAGSDKSEVSDRSDESDR